MSSCLLWEHGAGVQLLIVGTLGHVQGVQLHSEYIGAERAEADPGGGGLGVATPPFIYGNAPSSAKQPLPLPRF